MSPNDWTDHYFVPNGIVTYEDCPVCGAPDMRVEHGKSGRGSFQHFEHCAECGDSMPIVCYDCEYCKITSEETLSHNRTLLRGDSVDIEGL
jgi:transposase-like protein